MLSSPIDYKALATLAIENHDYEAILHHDKLYHNDAIAASNFTMPRYTKDDKMVEHTVFESKINDGEVGWIYAYASPTYHDMMKNVERDTGKDNKDYCYPCLWAGGTWNTKDDKKYCAFSNRILSYLWKANPHAHGPRGTDVPLMVDSTMSYKTIMDGLATCSGVEETFKAQTA